MLPKGVTLRGLEVFEALARSGSVGRTAELTGLSQPAVSQQLRNLEQALGTDLMDRARRPLRLTAAGTSFLSHASSALSELRMGQSRLARMDLSHLESLSIGLIDDFDHDLTPRLVAELADSLAGARFTLITAPSHDILTAMAERRYHIAVAANAEAVPGGIVEHPLVHDPFIVVAPRGVFRGPQDTLPPGPDLPLLRYARDQVVAGLIEGYLARQGLVYEERFEIGSHLALVAMVARGIGWAITTPLGYMRAARFHDQLDAFALPQGALTRRISLFAAADWADTVPRDIAATLRRLIETQMIAPAIDRLPWLADDFRIIAP